MENKDINYAVFHEYLAEHKLMGSSCKACGARFLPPRPMCTQCFSGDMEWTEYPQNGKLVAFTVIYIAPTAMIEAGYGRDNPYVSGIVELENGLAISAQILGLDPTKPEEIEVGRQLKAEYLERGEGEARQTFLAFRAI
jgi:uncharacterized OB-fold protein